jgi:hypothetical protein
MAEKIKGQARGEEIFRRWKILEQERESWRTVWMELAEFILPYAGRFNDTDINDGKKKSSGVIYDSKGTQALGRLAALMFTGMTPPSRPWFKMTTVNPELAEDPDVKAWLEFTEERIYDAMARSNFYLVMHQLFLELPLFGTACMYIEEDFESHIRCHLFPTGRYALALDGSGRVDTVGRQMQMSVRQIAQTWGEKVLPDTLKGVVESNPYQRFDVLHFVMPNDDLQPAVVGAQSMAFSSSYWLKGSQELLHESGYEEMPYLCPRWFVTGEDTYGRSPCLDVLADVKSLQRIRHDKMLAAALALRPPMAVPEGLPEVDMTPGALNSVPGSGGESIKPLIEVQPNLLAAMNEIQDVRQSIIDGLHNDLILMMEDHPNMTATEVMERRQEKMLMLGPIVERLQSELLGPVLDRIFGLLYRAGLVPPAPPVAQGADTRIEYISPLAQAQKRSGTDALVAATTFAGNLAQLDPGVLDRFDLSEAVQKYAELYGVPAKVIRSDQEVAQIREAKAQAQVQQAKAAMQMQEMGAGAEIAAKLGGIDMEKDNVLKRMLGEKTPEKIEKAA